MALEWRLFLTSKVGVSGFARFGKHSFFSDSAVQSTRAWKYVALKQLVSDVFHLGINWYVISQHRSNGLKNKESCRTSKCCKTEWNSGSFEDNCRNHRYNVSWKTREVFNEMCWNIGRNVIYTGNRHPDLRIVHLI